MERIGSNTRAYHSPTNSFVWDVPNVLMHLKVCLYTTPLKHVEHSMEHIGSHKRAYQFTSHQFCMGPAQCALKRIISRRLRKIRLNTAKNSKKVRKMPTEALHGLARHTRSQAGPQQQASPL